MYKIIGADQKEYGPISADQVRKWINEGRANSLTMAQAEGSPDWKPLSSFPEFADALAGRTPPPATPPRLDKIQAEALASEIINRGFTIDIGGCLSRGWDLVKNNFWLTVGVSFVMGLILGASGMTYIGPLIIGGALTGGLNWFFLKLIRGQRAGFEDAFAGFTLAFLQLMLGYLVMSLLASVGFLLCILPGIYLAVAWKFTLPLIIDKRMDFWDAMELSRKVITKRWWSLFGLIIVSFFVNLLGVLVCFIGVFVTIPITQAAMMYAYEDVFGTQPTQTPALPTTS